MLARPFIQSAPQGAGFSEAHLKCFYTNARSMRNKQEELEALVQFHSYDIVVISETCWEEVCDWYVTMDGYRLFKKNRQGRQSGRVALYVTGALDYTEFAVGNNAVDRLWVRINIQTNIKEISLQESTTDYLARMTMTLMNYSLTN